MQCLRQDKHGTKKKADLKEDTQITIKNVDRKVPQKIIREYRVSLKTDSKGMIIHRTNKINGFLKFILIKSEMITGNVSIITNDRLIILKTLFEKDTIFFPKMMNVDVLGKPLEIQSGQYSEIPLNDVLEIKIEGQPEQTVEFIIRYW